MKKRFLFFVLFLFVVMLQCKKADNPPETDYRDSFCGNFSFRTITWWETIEGTSHYDTTFYNSIIATVDSSDSLISIRYKPGENTHFCNDYSYGTNIISKVLPDGKLTFDIALACPHTIFEGYFIAKDTLIIEITQIALGGHDGDKILGVRVK